MHKNGDLDLFLLQKMTKKQKAQKKSKKSKKYLKRWKVLAAVLFFICAALLFFCGVVTINISKNWHMDVITADTVYDTREFCIAL